MLSTSEQRWANSVETDCFLLRKDGRKIIASMNGIQRNEG